MNRITNDEVRLLISLPQEEKLMTILPKGRIQQAMIVVIKPGTK
jgi:hypothetical protein